MDMQLTVKHVRDGFATVYMPTDFVEHIPESDLAQECVVVRCGDQSTHVLSDGVVYIIAASGRTVDRISIANQMALGAAGIAAA
jgi:hypothetical protein